MVKLKNTTKMSFLGKCFFHSVSSSDLIGGSILPPVSFPCLTRESTGRNLNTLRTAQRAQSGRSMVEMLGTLALIGVLSVVGLMGYNYLMNGVKANSILNEVNKRAHTCLTQFGFMDREECDLSEYNEDVEGFIVSVSEIPNDYFTLQLANVPKNICQQIKNRGFPNASQILPENCTDTNTVRFVFDKELKGNTENLPVFCSNANECNICQNCNSKGICQDKANKLIGYTDASYNTIQECYSCPSNNTYVDYTTKTECDKCGAGHFYADNRYCWNCATTNPHVPKYKVSQDECDRCSNRCRTKGGECHVIDFVKNPDTDGDGICDQNCPNGWTLAYTNPNRTTIYGCITCGTEGHFTTQSECQRCGNGYAYVNNQYCMLCTTTNTALKTPSASLNECKRCSNRCLDSNNKCVVFNGTTVTRGEDGSCMNAG